MFVTALERRPEAVVVVVKTKSDLKPDAPASPSPVSISEWSFSHGGVPVYENWSSLEGKVEELEAYLIKKLMANERRRESLVLPSDEFGDESLFHNGELHQVPVSKAYELICEAYGERRFVGERMYDSEGNRLLRYRWTTYSEMKKRSQDFAAGLNTMVSQRETVAMCSENSTNWVVADMALQSLNIISVMIHQTISEEDVEWLVNHAKLDAVVTAPHLLPSFARSSVASPHLKLIVLQTIDVGSSRPKIDEEALIKECQAMAGPNTKILSHSYIESLGSSLPRVSFPNTNDNELFTVSYTSGSTGKPKGLMLSTKVHKLQVLESRPLVATMSVFAPLSHSSRRAVYHVASGGGRVTLFNSDMAYLFEELQMTQPMTFIAVPRFWNILHGEFHTFVDLYKKTAPHKSDELIQETAQSLFLDLLGGKVLQIASGGAPATPAVFDWMHSFKGLQLVTQTYGAMEVGSVCLGTKLDDDCDWKLDDVPDMGYLTSDKPFPRGEFLAKSPLMFLGYHNSPSETDAALDHDGYFRTGDIVQMEGPDFIRVIDRKKFIFKLAQGEYVSPAKSEGVYSQSKFISHILCYGSSLQSYLIAIIVPDAPHLTSWALSHGINVTMSSSSSSEEREDSNSSQHESKSSSSSSSNSISFSQLCQLPQIKSLLLSEMRQCEQEAQMRPFERALDIIVISEDWTPENGLLTATSKLNRSAVVAKYRQQLEDLYQKKNQHDDGSGKPKEGEGEGKGTSSEALEKIKEVLSKVLAAKGEDVYVTNDLNLVSTGLDSMSAIKLVNSLNRELNISVPVSSLYQPGLTIETLAQAVENAQEKKGGDDGEKEGVVGGVKVEVNPEFDVSPFFWLADMLPTLKELAKERSEYIQEQMAKLGDEAGKTEGGGMASAIFPKPSHLKPSFDGSNVKNILLTGCTGFLGLHMIKELLDGYKEAKVYCLIRARSDEDAKARLDKALEYANVGIQDPEMKVGGVKYGRIEVVRGDLANPNKLGIDDHQWQFLCDNIDAIFHVGAWVNLIFPYHLLRAANVGSTALLLRMAMSGKKSRKQFHYVSTLSALGPDAHNVTYDDELFGFEGYPLTKRVCEVMLNRIERLIPDLPIIVHRVGAIFGHSTSGHINIEALIHKLFTGIVQYGYYPVANPGSHKQNIFAMNWAPVDYYAKTIVHIAQDGGVMPCPKRYNISNPAKSASFPMHLFASYAHSYGYSLSPKPLSLWTSDLLALFASAPGTNWLEPLKQMLLGVSSSAPAPDHFDLSFTLLSLSKDRDTPAAECGVLTEAHIHSVFDFCVQKGLLPPPPFSS